MSDEDDAKRKESVRTQAESTRFRAGPAVSPTVDLSQPSRRSHNEADTRFSQAKSIRLHTHSPRGGLAMRMAFPIILAMLAAIVVLVFVVRSRVQQIQLNDLKSDAGNAAFMTGLFGRRLLFHRDEFFARSPEYMERGEWIVGDHWLVTNGFVDKDEWVEATGFQLDEYAPASVLEQAGTKTILTELGRYLNSPRSTSEIAAAFILNADGTLFASSRKGDFKFDPLALKLIEPGAPSVATGDTVVYIDYVADIQPEPLVRGIARLMAYDDHDKLIGTVVVIMRTRRHTLEQNAFLATFIAMAVLVTLLIVLACWHSARKVTVPLGRIAQDMQAMAEGDFGRRAAAPEMNELWALAQAFNSMAERLRLARLNEKENSRLESDLSVAREIQNNLLPLQTPRVRGLDIFTSYRPAKEIGGDYFDFLPVDKQHMGLVVADASGKSIPAALVMSTTRAILRFVAAGNESAAETLSRVNSILSVDIPKGMFVTAYYVIYNPLTRTMLCASAGHTPLLVARADDSIEIFNPGGIALGFDGGPIFQRSIREQRVTLQSGDRVLLYTDGVVECMNTSEEEYSDRRLREFLRRNRDLTSHDFVGALLADLDRHRGAADMRDDTTIVTFKVL